ncbi:hypothetical protein DFR70_104396 [Nocardia tenerifensis]|uniref:Uncharacterized protein n=1 Tax=Nocardia tenerifensis TaxID=228006 RepID=A0A318KFJ2_9NOCA|nr:hypothetical protein [Nocardia tenerifensis]PXX65333.1 hypothetical protein DFR70_104396 [Nocardia tenerifensis]
MSPIPVRVAAAGIAVHAINHVVVLMFSPFSWNVGTVFHLVCAPLYAALVLPVWRGRNWARITITVLLGGQFLGRFVVWALFPSTGAHLALIGGWALSVVVLTLLWAPASTRRYFRAAAHSGTRAVTKTTG